LARLGSGTKNTTTFLRGDNTFATVSQESTVINNNADNRMITGSGTANTLNGEANLTFDGTTLGLTGNQTVSGTLGVTGAITGTLATAAQTNITSVGTLTSFRSTGIDDNADALAITIDSSERVGIGNASPNANTKLDVNGAARIGNNSDGIIIESNTGSFDIGNASYIRRDSSSGALELTSGSTTARDMLFRTGSSGAESMRINSSGNVGIGNTASGFNAQADNLIVGSGSGDSGITIFSGSGSGDTGNIFFADGTSGDDPTRGGVSYNHGDNSMNFRVNDAPKMYINSSGNVGIGTTSPSETLHVVGDAKATRIIGNALMESSSGFSSDTFSVVGGTTSNQSTKHGAVFFSKHVDSNALLVGTHDATFNSFVVKGSGNVGIGKSVPLSKLDVTGGFITVSKDANTAGRIGASEYITGSTANDLIVQATGSGATKFYQSGVNSLNIDSSGRLLLGTTTEGDATADDLTVANTSHGGITIRTGTSSEGSLFYSDGTSGADEYRGFVQYLHSSNSLRFGTNSAERMRISSSGQVGVGTTSPGYAIMAVHGATGGNATFKATNTSTSGNTTCIMAFMDGSGSATSNSAFLQGFNGVTSYYLLGNGTHTFTSDENVKKNIETTRDGYLEDLARLRVVKYNWKHEEDGANKELGLIAQEVEEVFPNLVMEDIDPQIEEGQRRNKMIKVTVLPFMLLKAIQELSAKNEAQQTLIESMEARLTALEGA